MIRCDVAVVGGGPAGLAVAIAAARRGLGAVVVERGPLPVDKACGEGLLPGGVAALERAGVLPLLAPAARAPLEGVRYVQEDGSSAEGCFPAPRGLGVRRTALAEALLARARALGVDVRSPCAALGHHRTEGGVELTTAHGPVAAKLLVAADGLGSRLRRMEGLEIPAAGPRRFGLRRHYQVRPWSPFVEVHLADGAEAYVTPVGPDRVGVALLWAGARPPGPGGGFDPLLARFPALAARLAGAAPTSRLRGAGPFARAARARVADRIALVGDAAGYVDALTGEGLSLAFRCAEALGELLPEALARGATREALWPYELAFQRIFRKYAWLTRGLLHLAARPRLRRPLVRWLSRNPRAFDVLLEHALA
uniref:Monooxygenase FAD-binding protein n=1 Tax=Jahnella sp. MSr9139 TaxID=1434086 RepID=A0A3Q8I8Z1_9BACT|nr:monooxygenase FAD-binding protein [Jahnella sp. MSr9139]